VRLALLDAILTPMSNRPSAPWLVVLLALTAAGCHAPGHHGERDSRPNIVFILADDMGYGDLRAQNPGSRLATPHLDGLAADGMRFSDGHSPSGVCTPTRYGFVTGRYCWRTSLKSGVLGGYSPPLLEEGRATIASMLQGAGYRTAAIGKWHLGMRLPYLDEEGADRSPWAGDPGIDFAGVITDSPIHHGFDHYFGVSASLDMAPYVYIEDDRFVALPTIQQPNVPFPHFVRKGPRSADFAIDGVLDELVERARSYITEAAAGDEPFFLYMPLTAPHKPTQPHERFRGLTGLGEYGDFLHQVDWSVGEVLSALEEAGVRDDTLVVFTSDNGSYMYTFEDEREDHTDKSTVHGFRPDSHRANGPLRGTKADIYEAGHRVPLLVRWPGRIEAGSTCDEAVCHTDWFATCAEIVGVELGDDEAEDSCSLLPLLSGQDARRGAPVVNHSAAGMFAIREGGWKLIAGNGSGGREKPKGKPFEGPYQLYDLDTDLGERADLIEAYPEIAERLSTRLEQLRRAGRSAPLRGRASAEEVPE